VPTAGSARVAATWLLAGAALCACAGETATPIPVGEPLPIGDYVLTIQRVQPAPDPGPPISTFREQPGRDGHLVFVQWSGLDALDPMSRIAFAEKYLEDRLTVVDRAGARHEPTGAMQASLLFMNDPGANWRDWIVVFHLPEESDGWVLEVENPEPAEGQSDHFAVDLGS
jgi:hypothetical protein